MKAKIKKNEKIKYPNPWKAKTYRETRFRSDYGHIKKLYTQLKNSGLTETESLEYVNGYRRAVQEIKLLNSPQRSRKLKYK